MSDLRDWLRRNNFEQYADAFEANDIDFDILPELSERDLERIEKLVPPSERSAGWLTAPWASSARSRSRHRSG